MTSNRFLLVAAMALLAMPSAAQAQVDLNVRVGFPTIRFEVPPPLVVVSDGVQVVPDYEQEVFYVDGWYWHRYRDVWYRTRDHRGGWVVAQRQYVPVALTRFPPGKYRRHHPGNGPRWVYVQEPDGRVTEVKVKGNGKVKIKGGNHGRGHWNARDR